MSIETRTRASGWAVAVGALGCLYSGLLAADYVPFPGKIRVTVLSVATPGEISVSYETWPGFSRKTLIKLPDVEIPQDTPQSNDCEREKAARAMEFTRRWLGAADKVFVKDMRMETSADVQAYSDILTDHSSLSQALKKEGLARDDKVARDASWCESGDGDG